VQPHSVHAYQRPASRQLFCLFTGNAGMLNVNPLNFIQRTGIGNCNILIFRDPYHACYERGISPDCSTLDGIASWVNAQLAGPFAGVQELFCVGTSSGGLPAIYVAHQCGARAAWSLGGRIGRPSVVEQREKLEDEMYRRVLGRVRPCLLSKEEKQRLIEAVAAPDVAQRVRDLTDPDKLYDRERLAELVAMLATSDARTRFHFYYATVNPVDRTFAEAFRSCAGATLHPLTPSRPEPPENSDPFNDPYHLVVPMLDATGELDQLFSPYLACA
jgi:hypothetical protein